VTLHDVQRLASRPEHLAKRSPHGPHSPGGRHSSGPASSHLMRTTIPIDALPDQLFRSKSADLQEKWRRRESNPRPQPHSRPNSMRLRTAATPGRAGRKQMPLLHPVPEERATADFSPTPAKGTSRGRSGVRTLAQSSAGLGYLPSWKLNSCSWPGSAMYFRGLPRPPGRSSILCPRPSSRSLLRSQSTALVALT